MGIRAKQEEIQLHNPIQDNIEQCFSEHAQQHLSGHAQQQLVCTDTASSCTVPVHFHELKPSWSSSDSRTDVLCRQSYRRIHTRRGKMMKEHNNKLCETCDWVVGPRA